MYGKRETNQEGIMGHPTIYPTGVTVYNPEKCWNGFTIFQAQMCIRDSYYDKR